jgi:hypothetical protein
MSEKFPDGWFRDPEHPGQLRYWDGSSWTGERMPIPSETAPEPTSRWAAPAATNEGSGFSLKKYALPIAAGMVALITIVAIFASGAGRGSGDDDAPGVTTPTAAESTAPSGDEGYPEPDAAKTVSVGDSVTLGGTEYTVKSAKQLNTRAPESAEGTPAAYVAVELEVANRQRQTRTFPVSAATIIGSDDERYPSDGEAAVSAGYKDSLLFNAIDPDETTSGILVFDVPVAAIEGATLELRDLFGSRTAVVDLGL